VRHLGEDHAAQFLSGVAEHPLDGRIGLDGTPGQVDQHDADRRIGEDRPKARLALA